ncbi:MAG: MotA/TolQ/ExbB proton channel family protein [Coriobacteriales bacterium]|jgi:biopolymer transport protein ExbB/TolQ|nr:MotA/TolQ/ExbB proton channel family protein [Coriobacteriales bacterium]
MESDGLSLYISTILHYISQGLLIPVMIVLVGLIIFALYCVGSIITEALTERRHFKTNIPQVINNIYDADYSKVEDVIETSALLRPQKAALLMVIRNMGLTEDDLFALAKTQVAKVDDRYKRILARTEQVTKIAPMMGLMCTLIPLGPGIVAMGEGNVNLLSMSLLIAFDGTVAGLVAAVVSLIVSGLRKRWYNQYLMILESLMTCILDKATQARQAGIELPHDYYDEQQYIQQSPIHRRLLAVAAAKVGDNNKDDNSEEATTDPITAANTKIGKVAAPDKIAAAKVKASEG